jgi:hypothetical protein
LTRPRLVLLAALAAVVVGVVVERLIVTDREAITATIEDDAAAVSRDDWDAVARTIADDYSEGGRDKAALIEWARRLWRSSGAARVSIDVGDIRVEGDHAAARIVVRPGSRLSGFEFPGRLDFVRTHDGWRIDGVAADDPSLLHR